MSWLRVRLAREWIGWLAFLMMLLLCFGCASTTSEVVRPISPPDTEDGFHDCVWEGLSLFASERVAIAEATGRDIGTGGIGSDRSDEGSQEETAVSVSMEQLSTIVSLCSVTADQMQAFRDLQLECLKQADCRVILSYPTVHESLMETVEGDDK